MTAWEDSGFPLVGHRDSPYGVRVGVSPESPLLSGDAGGLWIRTVGHPRSGPPVIGVGDAPVLSGWGQALVQVPPGRHLVTAQIQGAGECGRTVEVPAGGIVELDFVESRLGGKGVLGPSGRVRGTGLTGPRLITVILGVQAVAIAMLVTLLNSGEGWLFALLGWLVWTVLATWLVSLPIRWRGRSIVLAQSGEAVPYDGGGEAPGTLLPALRRPPVPRPPERHGGLLLHVDVDQNSTQDGSPRFDAHESWTPPPSLSVDGIATAVGHGPWFYPLPAGVHRVRLVPPTMDGHEPATGPVELEVTIDVGRVTHYDVELRVDLAYGRGGHLSAYEPFLSAILRDKHSPPGSTRIGVTSSGPQVPR
ncbi:hypothetical protein [Phytomonospora endophytica]|uniref:Uncharacterized protein n=1 Tax=Phytomonospora endophytica TaxID=714109 RepID=A0A841FD84_9ACTN|nr:hypothetical protein [Phytomonospora endophytica]MBB6033395.1 hypothetical protein [Phytomonospora endophytica]GIG70834.1 hypothetical protein Pen01_71290 [Phytomonospora endophytica]